LKIAKTSWHYRFNKFNNDNFESRFNRGHYTTCSYIRTTLASMLAATFKCAVILCVAAVILWVIGSMVVVPFVVFMGIMPYDLAAVTCVMGWIFLVGGLFILLVNQINEWIKNIEYKTNDRPKKEPNVFVQAVIDKHNKFCTLVTAAD